MLSDCAGEPRASAAVWIPDSYRLSDASLTIFLEKFRSGIKSFSSTRTAQTGQTSNCILEDSFSEDFEAKLISKMGFSQNLWKPSIVSWFSVGHYLLINTFSLDTTLE